MSLPLFSLPSGLREVRIDTWTYIMHLVHNLYNIYTVVYKIYSCTVTCHTYCYILSHIMTL